MSYEGEEEIHPTCKSLNGNPHFLIWNKVKYIPEADVNRISKRQIHREDLQRLEITW